MDDKAAWAIARAVEDLRNAFAIVGLEPPVALVLKDKTQLYAMERLMDRCTFMIWDPDPTRKTQIMGVEVRADG